MVIIIIMIITAIAILRVQLDVFFTSARIRAQGWVGGWVGTTSHQVILLVTVSEKKI